MNNHASSVIRHGQPASLNPFHTHFLLVDNGVKDSYQSVAQFRAKLENKISQPKHAAEEKGTFDINKILDAEAVMR